jgi:hypothetical protein
MPIVLDPENPKGKPSQPGVKPVGHEPGKYLHENYDIVTKLFADADGNKKFRDSFFNCKSEEELHQKLRDNKIYVNPGVKIMIVDIQYARTKDFGIDPVKDDFYVYILPPVPQRTTGDEKNPSEGYKDTVAWEEAWHHAICDGYGM